MRHFVSYPENFFAIGRIFAMISVTAAIAFIVYSVLFGSHLSTIVQ